MWCPFRLIRHLILCMKLQTMAYSVAWGILALSLRRDVLKASIPVWATEDTFAFNKDHTRIHDIQIRWHIRLHILNPECWKMAPVLSFSCGVKYCSILLRGERLIFQVLLYLFKCWNQNAVCVDLNLLLHKITGKFQNLETAAHTMRKHVFFDGKLFSQSAEYFA